MSDGAALAAFLSIEGLLLATIGLCVSLSTPQSALRNMPVRALTLALASTGLLALVAAGATLTWFGVYTATGADGPREILVAAILLITIVSLPVIALMLSLGLRIRD